MAEIKFEIKEITGVLSESPKGWKKELNLISWNDKEPKYDIRDWDSEHKKMGKGITFTLEELKKLKDMLNNMDFDKKQIKNDQGKLKAKVVLADVLYTNSDETFYVLEGQKQVF